MKVAIRADASVETGTGHLMRCLVLADALAAMGDQVTFLCAPATAPWRRMIEGRGHRHVTLPIAAPSASQPDQRSDAEAVLGVLSSPVDWLIVDHYDLDHRWESQVRPRASRVLAIDDLANRVHDCDVLLDQNGQCDGARYDGLVPTGMVRLLGTHWALLRPSFVAARAVRAPSDGGVRRISVFMGGTDVAGGAGMALAALSRADLRHIDVDVLIGGQALHRRDLEAAAAVRGNTQVHVDLPDPAALFAAADLAIGAGGIAALERCCLRLPTITIAVADNQALGLAWLSGAGAVRHMGPLDGVDPGMLADEISSLCRQPEQVKDMAERAAALVDGYGTARVARTLYRPKHCTRLRKATMEDAPLLHRWRDDPAVRALSMTTAPIVYTDHCRWLEQALGDPGHLVFVAMVGHHPVGSLRYRLEAGEATVSVVVAPEMRGEGIGREILQAGEAHLRAECGGSLKIVAEVKPSNHASVQLFTASGFELDAREPARMLYGKRLT